jgi:hypothetical protein
MSIFKKLGLFPTKEVPETSSADTANLQSFGLLFGSGPAEQQKGQSKKNTVVLVGNCLAEMMAFGLSSMPAPRKQFSFVAIPLHLRTLDEIDVRSVIANASHIFLQGIVAGHLETIRSISSPDVEILFYPDVVLRSPWPFDHMSGQRDIAVDAAPNPVINHHDYVLAKLREAIPDKERRFRAYRDLDFEDATAIDRVIEAQHRFLDSLDRQSDAYFGRFIMRHYKESQLFFDSVHPTRIMVQEMCEFVWRKLEIRGEPSQIKALPGWGANAAPVHPAIAHRLGLTWASEHTRYNCGELGLIRWDEWVRAYIDTFG